MRRATDVHGSTRITSPIRAHPCHPWLLAVGADLARERHSLTAS